MKYYTRESLPNAQPVHTFKINMQTFCKATNIS